MPYCQNCGTEVEGNFCPNCGAQAGSITSSVQQLIIHENVDIRPRFNAFHLLIAGWPALACLIATLACVGMALFADYPLSDKFMMLFCALISAGLAFLCYLPGINAIRKRSPDGEALYTFKTFFVKSLLFIILWGVTISGYFYIIGFPLKAWRLGMWVSNPKDDQYTAFVDGEKISVTRCVDNLPDYGIKGKWVYVDENGEFYRPPVH